MRNSMNIYSSQECAKEVDKLTPADLERYLRPFPLRRNGWHEQLRYDSKRDKGPFFAAHRILTDGDILRHLDRSQRYWIACNSPLIQGEPVTSFLLLDFDVDPDNGRSRGEAWSAVQAVMNMLGWEFRPLVYTSPGNGYHVIYFFDQETRLFDLVDPRRPQSGGLIPDIVREATGDFGAGVCEVFPQPKQVVRWPLGTDQYPVDVQTGMPAAEDDVRTLLDAVEQHRLTVPALSVEHLSTIHNGIQELHAAPTSPQMQQEVPAKYRGEVHPDTVERVRCWYRDGLSRTGTRNTAMFLIARVMVHAPEVLVDLGFDPGRDRAQQLHEWLRTKHNGNSNDYPGSAAPNEAFWERECRRMVQCAASRPAGGFPKGRFRLTEAEWDEVFRLGYAENDQLLRHRIELVAAGWLRKAKWSVLVNNVEADSDGTYTAEIHSDWRHEMPFCKRIDSEMRYRRKLENAGLFSLKSRGSPASGQANRYHGFPLDLYGPQRELPFTPRKIKEMADELDVPSIVLEYCLEARARFPDDERFVERYGEAGTRYILGYIQEIERLAGPVTRGSASVSRPDGRDDEAELNEAV